MNASFPSESSRQVATPQGNPQGGRQTPSVPISVYRELATELKATQAMVESLTHQNQQLTEQNQMLRQEMLHFADSADRLRQAVGYRQPQVSPDGANPHEFMPSPFEAEVNAFGYGLTVDPDPSAESASLSERFGDSVGGWGV
jgi:TolA-binding protein